MNDQPRTTVPLDLTRPLSISNSVYIHRMCRQNEFEIIHSERDIDTMNPYDVYKTLEGIRDTAVLNYKGTIDPKWRFYKLKEYFASTNEVSVTLTFKQIEDIIEHKLPKTALINISWWYPKKVYNSIAEAWVMEGYELTKVDLEEQRVIVHRREEGASNLKIPNVLTSGKLPDNAVYELETFMDYIINKYGLRGRR